MRVAQSQLDALLVRGSTFKANQPSSAAGAACAQADAEAADLCRRIRAGEAEAFEKLFDVWFDRASRQAAALSGRDEAFCCDVAQEVFVRVMKGLPPLGGVRALEAWMSVTVRSAVLDAVRRESRRTSRERIAVNRAGEVVEGPNAEEDELETLKRTIAGLDEKDREILRGRFAMGFSLERLGAMFGLSGDAVHGRIRRAMAAMRLGVTRGEKR